ncbi:response regulator transcription factor [Paenibacillus spongiae]|uniref:Response regulator n=1 Tax=Paenibacillus spongiae TaxID=2909671 RepID=A0ABY5SCM3_9BACL|nr:response regulator [Paenibacillus spongiae]UVI31704.1 response regulator [Paenibacillus spongiae]
MNVLIVEDDHLVRKGLMVMMPWAEYGLNIAGEASNGEEAVMFLREHDVDLLITDLIMPKMSGIDLLRYVRVHFPRISTVVLTFHQDFEYVQEALRLGAIDYIAKVELQQEMCGPVLERITNRIKADRSNAAQPAGESPSTAENVRQSEIRMFYGGGNTGGNHEAAISEDRGDEPMRYDESDIRKLRDRISSLQWIVDDALFRQTMEELAELRLPASKVEGLFNFAVSKWEMFSAIPSLSRLGSMRVWDDWIDWIHETRTMLQGQIKHSSYSNEVSSSILKAVEIIHRDIAHELRLKDVASDVHLSPSYFSQCFRDIMGSYFNDYVRQARMSRAQTLLKETKKPVYWIAAQIGYPNEKYFSKVFREHTGMLPSEYRTNNT